MSLTEKEIKKELMKIEIKIEGLTKICNSMLENLVNVESKCKDLNAEELKKMKILMFLPILLTLREEIEEACDYCNKD